MFGDKEMNERSLISGEDRAGPAEIAARSGRPASPAPRAENVVPSHPDAPGASQTDSHEASRSYRRAIEGYAGTVRVPVGLAGPLKVRGRFASGSYQVPLATTEAALVASYRRGARVLSEAGGCSALLIEESINRTPCFGFADAAEALRFADWARSRLERFRMARSSRSIQSRRVISRRRLLPAFASWAGCASSWAE